MKIIGSLDPTPAFTPQQCERHYLDVHVRLAQDQGRSSDSIVSYHIDRAISQVDINGRFEQRPRAWRFYIMRFAEGAAPALQVTPGEHQANLEDFTQFLSNFRCGAVREEVVLDRLSGQVALGKFLIEVERRPDADVEQAAKAFDLLATQVHDGIADAFGARLMIVNRAIDEWATEPIEYPGQSVVGVLPETTRLGFLECYFDHRRWGEEALGALFAHGGLRDPGVISGLRVMHVAEEAPFDRR